MFDRLPTAPPDAIFGLMAAFREDPRPEKINLGAGIYLDEQGSAPILDAVKQAERRLWERETSKSYLAIDGDSRLTARASELLLGDEHEPMRDGRLVVAHTPGGTGSLRLIADVLQGHRPQATVWLPEPTWVNHPQIFAAAGLATRGFPYLDRSRRELDFDALTTALGRLERDDVVVLHGCCHNPSGIDPSREQWRTLGRLLGERGAVPLIDVAYLGFARGLDEDTVGLRELDRQVEELIVCLSFSKSFALYNERIGALLVKTAAAAAAEAVRSQIKAVARATYSNPPAHGAAIVATILGDPELCAGWKKELDSMRRRIQEMRRRFVAGLNDRHVELGPQGNDFLLRQLGMFSFSGLSREQVSRLRRQHSIYMVDSGRLNFAGMTAANLPRLCDAVAGVV